MNIILMHIGFGLMTAAAITALIVNTRQRRLIKKLMNASKGLSDLAADAVMFRTAHDLSQLSKAEVEERMDGIIPCFAVYRKCLGKKIDVLHIGYDPNDPEDKEYKRIFAEERADMLNEKP